MYNKVNINSEIIIANLGKSNTANNFSLRSSPAVLVSGVYLSAPATFRLDRKSPAIRPCRKLPTLWASLSLLETVSVLWQSVILTVLVPWQSFGVRQVPVSIDRQTCIKTFIFSLTQFAFRNTFSDTVLKLRWQVSGEFGGQNVAFLTQNSLTDSESIWQK